MATRTHTSFQKRQKELARMEKQREKAARKLQRKLTGKQTTDAEEAPSSDSGAAADEVPGLAE